MKNLIATLNIVVFLWLINFIPPFLAVLLNNRWDTPLDKHRTFPDGKPWLGNHKTIRGVIGALCGAAVSAPMFSFSTIEGTIMGSLAMFGDLITSFFKRRLNLPSGTVVFGIDQFFESFLPLLYWKHLEQMSWKWLICATVFFIAGAYQGSIFFKKTILNPPSPKYPRPLTPRTRLREWKSCQPYHNAFSRLLNFEDAIYYHLVLYGILRVTGLYEIGIRNALVIKERVVEVWFPHLPADFDGYEILFMSDLHIDAHEALSSRLAEVLRKTTPADLVVLGGDYRFDTVGTPWKALSRMVKLAPVLKSRSKNGVLAVLGNHDCIEMAFELEAHGIIFLINDHSIISRGASKIAIAGIDDPHYYKCHDIAKAIQGIPKGTFTILVSHSPEVYREAARMGIDLYICGHTHAGQIQIPRIGPVFTHSRTGRRFAHGLWKYDNMVGYTSSGVGSSSIFTRFGASPEIVRIRLRRKDHLRTP